MLEGDEGMSRDRARRAYHVVMRWRRRWRWSWLGHDNMCDYTILVENLLNHVARR